MKDQTTCGGKYIFPVLWWSGQVVPVWWSGQEAEMASWCCARQLSQHSATPVSELRKRTSFGGSRKQEKVIISKLWEKKTQLWVRKRSLRLISENRNILLHCTKLGTSLCHGHSCSKNCTWDSCTYIKNIMKLWRTKTMRTDSFPKSHLLAKFHFFDYKRRLQLLRTRCILFEHQRCPGKRK